MPYHPRGTLSLLVPLSPRALKGEGERRIGACICASAQMHAPNSVPGEGERRRDWGLGDVVGPSSVQVGRGKEERLGLGVAMWSIQYGGGGKRGEVGDLVMLCGLVREGGDGFTTRRTLKAHPPKADVPLAASLSGSGGGMTRVRQIGDGASPRFLAEPRNDSVVGVSAGMDEVGGRAWYRV